MASDRVVIELEDRARQVAKEPPPRGDAAPSEDAVASALLAHQGPEYRHIAPQCRWIKWGGKRRVSGFHRKRIRAHP